MSRRNRLEYENSFHHVMDRGYLKKQIFLDGVDFEYFLNIVWTVCESHKLIVHAYCIMTNHFHLLVQNPLKNISSAMHLILLRYAIYFNKKYNQKGKVFERQFLSPLIDTENYLVTVSKYIHRNPLDGVVSDLRNWNWSSYNFYQNSNLAKPKFLESSLILKKFKQDFPSKAYADFVLESSNWNPFDTIYSQTILGSDEYIKSIACKYLGFKINTEIKDSFKLNKISNQKIFDAIKQISAFDFDEATKQSILLYFLRKKTNFTLKEISQIIYLRPKSNSSMNSKLNKIMNNTNSLNFHSKIIDKI
jgi:REP element-mobilizing transposase RayT